MLQNCFFPTRQQYVQKGYIGIPMRSDQAPFFAIFFFWMKKTKTTNIKSAKGFDLTVLNENDGG